MPKAIICIHQCSVNRENNKAAVTYDFFSDVLQPGQPMELHTHTQGLIERLNTEGFTGHGLSANDIIIFGGAQ